MKGNLGNIHFLFNRKRYEKFYKMMMEDRCISGCYPPNSSAVYPLGLKKSNRGNPILVDWDGYEYSLDCTRENPNLGIKFSRWRCRNRGSCKSRLKTGPDNIILKQIGVHSCKGGSGSKCNEAPMELFKPRK